MIRLRISLLVAVLSAAFSIGQVWAQAQPAKTSERQARSYILSAFMTGAAPTVLSDEVKIAPIFRERLALTPESDSRAIYYALVRMTAGKSLTVRPAKIDELERTETNVEPGKPMFALDVSDTTFVMQYDLERDFITTIADASRPVAVTSPVSVPEPPQPIIPTAMAAADTAAPAPEPLPGARVQVVEPREPKFNQPAPPPMTGTPAVMAMQPPRDEPRPAPLKPNGACVIKPVMSDQDLVNCGAKPR